MTAIVVDASALAEVVLRSERSEAVESLIHGHDLCAPDIVNAEVLAVIRGLLMRGIIEMQAAHRAVANLISAPVRRMTTTARLADVWQMHRNVTPYDACYVALARRLGTPLLTLDQRLARAPGLDIELLAVSKGR